MFLTLQKEFKSDSKNIESIENLKNNNMFNSFLNRRKGNDTLSKSEVLQNSFKCAISMYKNSSKLLTD